MPPGADKRLVERVHDALALVLGPGDRAIDATVGNGHDTVQLVRLVGAGGRVTGFDLQRQAIDATRKRLEEAGLADRADLQQADHADLDEALARTGSGPYRAAVFNLGYLPGSDHAIRTGPRGTLAALDACARRLAPGGLIAVTAYRGHPGGIEEAEMVGDWMVRRQAESWRVERHEPAEARQAPPVLWLASRPATG